MIHGVQTLSAKSNLLILTNKNWSIHDMLGSNGPQDVRNLHKGYSKTTLTPRGQGAHKISNLLYKYHALSSSKALTADTDRRGGSKKAKNMQT